MIGVNLLPASFIEVRRRRARIRAWGMICAVHAMLVAGVGVVTASGGETSTTLRTKVGLAQSRLESKGKEIDALRRTLADRARRVEAVRAIADHPNWSILLEMLATLRGSDVVLERVAIEPDAEPGAGAKPGVAPKPRYLITIEGLARSNAAVLEYALAIQRVGIFESVRPEQTRQRDSGAGDLFGFQLKCVLGEAPAQGGAR